MALSSVTQYSMPWKFRKVEKAVLIDLHSKKGKIYFFLCSGETKDTPRHALPRHQNEENGNINFNKYFISSSGNQTHNLQSHSVPLRHDWPQIK